ncbi:long-chain fatty acid transport protein [Limibacter armeniacum]|uniref:long-chain fatty acid transport protein n=1 Tax=Limibacter armeniacum TaxID=466084 RepID=UPI002FE50ACF
MKIYLYKFLLVLLVLFIQTFDVLAQDGHYWTQHYGTKSMLLSNSVIGGVSDLGAVFYNPARLGMIDNPAFLLSADVYELNSYKFEDAVGENANLSKRDFGGVPSMAAGTFKLGFAPKHHFAYAVLQRQRIDLDLSYDEESFGDVLEAFPGDEYFRGLVRFKQNVKEEWFSVAWSYPVSEKLSLGLTTNGVIFEQSKGNNIELQALAENNEVAIFRFNRNFSFKKYGLIWKAGLSYLWKDVLLGLTVTTPMIEITGDGKYEFGEFFSGIEGVSTSPDLYTADNQSGLSAKRKTPLSIGLGASIPFNKSSLNISAEWFSGISSYTVMEIDPFVSQSDGDTINFQLVDDLNSVINVGVGAEIYLSEKVSGYVSMSTDFSAVPTDVTSFFSNGEVASNTAFSADYYHFAGGVVLNFKGADITLGTAYTGGSQDFARPFNFPEEGESNDIFDPNETAKIKWSRWRLVFSFSVPFFKDYAKKLEDKFDKKKE